MVLLSGNRSCRLRLGKAHLFGWGTQKNPDAALAIFEDKAYDYLPEGLFLRGLTLTIRGETRSEDDDMQKGMAMIKAAAAYANKDALQFLSSRPRLTAERHG